MQPSFHHITNLGWAYRRYGDQPFGIRLRDRLAHLHVIGQTGTGKSTLLFNMALQDAKAGLGFCLIDPHGDLTRQLHDHVAKPHLYWDVADPDCPYGYNPVTPVPAQLRALVTSGLIDALKRQWSDALGARMEHLLRYAVLALLEQREANIRDILRLYFEKAFRQHVVASLEDAQVRAFWSQEFPAMNYKTAIDGVAPIANKLGAFLANPVVRKAICEPKEPLRFRRIMDEGQGLIVNLAKGRLGADTSNVLGGLIVSSVINAAFSRYDEPEAARRPFMVYVDEFHSFTTAALASMLPETRKYGLGATLAQQHVIQADREVFEAILGNAGSLMVFRIGAQDAPIFERQLGSVAAGDLIHLPNYRAFVQLLVDGEKTKTFSATTLPMCPSAGKMSDLGRNAGAAWHKSFCLSVRPRHARLLLEGVYESRGQLQARGLGNEMSCGRYHYVCHAENRRR